MAGITWTDWSGDGSLVVVDVGLACCTLEYEAARARRPSATGGADLADAPVSAAYVVVISGTVTDVLVPAVLSIVDACRARDPHTRVISFGACASSGGPYWDSYAVTKGIGQFVAVETFVAGCPPVPDALERALLGTPEPA